LVSEAAANTVGLEGTLDAGAPLALVGVLLLPHPPVSTAAPIAAISSTALRITPSPIVPGSWQNTRIMACSSLRERRRECGLTQAQVAARAGVSRQLVAAVESGHNVPAVDAALGLARALGTTVEDLFATMPTPATATPALPGRLRERAPLRVGRVGERLVAAELADHGTAGAGWASPDGILERGRLRLFAGAAPSGMVIAGCDPALGIAEAMLAGLGPRSMLALSAASGIALRALGRGDLHAAVVHGPEHDLPQPPVAVVRLHLARWRVGLGVAPARRGRSLLALLTGGAPIAQRDPAAASQQALERAAADAGIPAPPGPRADGHIHAARLAATLGCAAVTTESAALAFGLRFLPLEEHVVQVWLAERWREQPAVAALGDVLTSAAFTDRVAQFGGYDLADCGARV
jgi:DNA-binding XRE family transcriptional regulator